VPHFDSVESVIDYRVPVEKFTGIAKFDGSVIFERTTGEVSARCHDEQANMLALNLVHDIVSGANTVDDARPTMRRNSRITGAKSLRSTWKACDSHHGEDGAAADPDVRLLSDEGLEAAMEEGRRRGLLCVISFS
jgi:hypothetical protein